MPYHYQTFKRQLAADIAASQSFGAGNPIRFGRVIKPIVGLTHAVVATSMTTEYVGRGVHEVYAFSIALRYLEGEASSDTDDIETFLFARAEALCMRLAPHVADPAAMLVNANYAGIGFENWVTAVDPTDGTEVDADQYVTIVVDFTVKATVYQ